MEKLWQTGQIGPMQTKNRTVRSATNEHLATREGVLTQAWAQTYLELARGGVGVIITGHFAVDATQRADEGQPVADERFDTALFRRTCDGVHTHGAKLVVQLSHTGLKSPSAVNGCPAKGPADFTGEDFENLVKRFAFAAKTCQAGGADGVQIHLAHGYLLSSFLNPKENSRTDGYGGSLENRFRLSGEVIRAVREACGPEFAILVKVDSNGCGDLRGLLTLCQQAGVDCAEVSGLDCAARPGVKQAFYLDEVLEAKQGLGMPVSLVGGVFSLEEALRVLDGGVEFVSFSRALIHQPDFIAKLERGEVVHSGCLACGKCFQVYRQRPVRCVLHTQPIPQLEQVFGPYEKK